MTKCSFDFCAVASCPHSLPVPILTGQKWLKWTTTQFSESRYRWGELVRDSCLSVYENGTGKENRFGDTTCICVSAGYNRLTHVICYLRVCPVVKTQELEDLF